MKKILFTAAALFSAVTLNAETFSLNAGADLLQAVAGAADGDTIELAEGEYELNGELILEKPLTIKGVGIDKTIIRQTASDTRVITLNNADARVESVTITGGFFTSEHGNQAGQYGGAGVLILQNGGTLKSCRITDNKTNQNHNRGIGIDEQSGNALVEDCIIDNNGATAKINGSYGGIKATSGTYKNCLIYKNCGQSAGGVMVSGAATFINCTITGNSLISGGYGKGCGGIQIDGQNAIFTDCIIALNFSHDTDTAYGKPEWNGSGNATFNNCAISAQTSQANIKGTPFYAIPLFLYDEDGFPYKQRLASPTRDIGYNAPYDYSILACDFLASSERILVNNDITFTSSVSGVNDTDTLSYEWTITKPDNSTETFTTANLTYTPALAGQYSCSLSVTKNSESPVFSPVSAKFIVCITSASVSTTEELLNALSLAGNETVITVAPGTYELTDEILLSDAVTLRGDGPITTILKQTVVNKRLINMNNARAVVEGFTLCDAVATDENRHGICVYIGGDGGTIRNCHIINNKKTYANWTHGIGVTMYGDGLIDSCVITNNSCGTAKNSRGGGIYAQGGTIRNSLIAENDGNCGGGVFNETSPVTIIGCTIVNNRSTDVNAGLRLQEGSSLINTIVYNNISSASGSTVLDKDLYFTGPRRAIINSLLPSDVEGTYTGESCVYREPKFENASMGDFRPTSASPSIDAGNDTYAEGNEFDLNGEARFSGESVDIGCYEFDSSAFSASYDLSQVEGFAGAQITATASCSGLGEGQTISYDWILTDPTGTVTTYDTTEISFATDIIGFYNIKLVGTLVGTSKTSTFEGTYLASPRKMYVVPATAENAAKCQSPYGTPETAATNVQDAVDIALPETEIYLSEGVHTVKRCLDVTKHITIKGAGYERSSLTPQYENNTFTRMSILKVNNPNASVSGLTICGLRAKDEVYQAGAATIDANGGLIEDCRVTDNIFKSGINHARGIGISIKSSNGRVNRCIIDRNTGSTSVYGDMGGGIYAEGGIIENSLIYFNTNQFGGGIAVSGNVVIRNCTVFGNVGTGSGYIQNAGGVSLMGIGGIAVLKGAAECVNTIVFENESPNESGYAGYPEWSEGESGGKLNLINSLLPSEITLPSGAENCKQGDPGFISTSDDNFRFKLPSPCRNAGINCEGVDSALDLDGRRRRYGKYTDIGCYELPYGPQTILKLR